MANNRLSTFIKTQKSARMLVKESELALKKGNASKAILMLQGAIDDLIVSMNCAMSLRYEVGVKKS